MERTAASMFRRDSAGRRSRVATTVGLVVVALLGLVGIQVAVGVLPASAASVVQTIGVGNNPDAISSDGTHVWVANANDNTVTELNASDGSFVQTITVGNAPVGVSAGQTHLWVANGSDNTVSDIVVVSPQIITFTSTPPSGVAVGGPSYTPVASGGGSSSPVVITLDSTSTGCTLNGGVVSFTGVGTCVVDANQAGDADNTAAPRSSSPLP